MSYLRTASERAAYRRIFYPNTETYVNKLGIRDRKRLEDTERALTSRRASLVFPPQAHCRSYAEFKAIHRHLFQDLYAWANTERRYITGRGSIPLAVPEHIASRMRQQFKQPAQERYLVGRDKAQFPERAAVYVNRPPVH